MTRALRPATGRYCLSDSGLGRKSSVQYWNIGEAAARERLDAFLDDQVARLSRGPRLPRPGRDLKALASSRAWRNQRPADLARGPMPRAARAREGRRGRKVPLRTRLARLQHPPALPPARHRQRRRCSPSSPGFDWRQSDADLRAWQRGETGIRHRRCRHARTVGDRLHAQPGPHAGGLAADQEPAARLAPRGTMVLGLPRRRRRSPATRATGNGSPAAATMRRPISASSIPSPKAELRPRGAYVRRWAPMPHEPIVDLKTSRERALAAFQALYDTRQTRTALDWPLLPTRRAARKSLPFGALPLVRRRRLGF